MYNSSRGALVRSLSVTRYGLRDAYAYVIYGFGYVFETQVCCLQALQTCNGTGFRTSRFHEPRTAPGFAGVP